nr:histidine phosphatase family protein [uncultured Acidocella sp.]
MIEIFLLRPGETLWNMEGRFQGKLDSALTERGLRQAIHLGGILAGVLGCSTTLPLHVSPLGRALETAKIVGQHVCFADMMVPDFRLQEVSAGSWDGLTHEEIEAGWPGVLEGSDQFDWYFRSPDGETLDKALGRVRSWLNELDGPVVVVSHGLLGRLMRGLWAGMSPAEMLRLPVPQDLVWHLTESGIHQIPVPIDMPAKT